MITGDRIDVPLPSPPWPDTSGSLEARRVQFLDADHGDQLLSDPLVRLIIADGSGAFRWVDLRETHRVWRRDVRPRLDLAATRPSMISTEEPGTFRYRASEWRDSLGGRLVIVEVVAPAT